MGEMCKYFKFFDGGEYLIEVDLCKVDYEIVVLFGEFGFNWMSVGVQDFDECVQVVVNCVQSEEEIFNVIKVVCVNGFKLILVDLIYGLLYQMVIGFNCMLECVLVMDLECLLIYNYVYMFSLFKLQCCIVELDLLLVDVKLQIFVLVIKKLIEVGYVFIGMDYFVKLDDEFVVVQCQGCLYCNFQGYLIYVDCDMFFFGILLISKVGLIYSQNVKMLDEYYD